MGLDIRWANNGADAFVICYLAATISLGSLAYGQ